MAAQRARQQQPAAPAMPPAMAEPPQHPALARHSTGGSYTRSPAHSRTPSYSLPSGTPCPKAVGRLGWEASTFSDLVLTLHRKNDKGPARRDPRRAAGLGSSQPGAGGSSCNDSARDDSAAPAQPQSVAVWAGPQSAVALVWGPALWPGSVTYSIALSEICYFVHMCVVLICSCTFTSEVGL